MTALSKIGHKISVIISVSISMTLILIAYLHGQDQQKLLENENRQSLKDTASSVQQGLESIMLAGYADIAQGFANSLRNVPNINDFRIMRTNGLEAFRDNSTIKSVNTKKGEEVFFPRDEESQNRIIESNSTVIQSVLENKEPVYINSFDGTNHNLSIYLPVLNREPCQKCHTDDHEVRGIFKIEKSLNPMNVKINRMWTNTILITIFSIFLLTLFILFILNRTIVSPILRLTGAMAEVADGDLNQFVSLDSSDEIGAMAHNFNIMVSNLLESYTMLNAEQNKLSTVISSAQEGIIITNEKDDIVLCNTSAELILDRKKGDILKEDILNIFGDKPLMENLLLKDLGLDTLISFNEKLLEVVASKIYKDSNQFIGTGVLIRDVTHQKKLETALKKLSVTDPLTGLYNRRALEAELEKSIYNAERYNQGFAIILYDLDHFKSINDTYGHHVGDDVLVESSQVISSHLRETDLFCRFGGEEFIILLYCQDQPDGVFKAEALRKALTQITVEHSPQLKVSASFGVVNIPPGTKTNADHVLTRADQAMYQAKHSGRNCVVLFDL